MSRGLGDVYKRQLLFIFWLQSSHCRLYRCRHFTARESRACDAARRQSLLPVAGHVHDPVPAGRLLLVMPLVLAGGVGVVGITIMVLALGIHRIAMCVEAVFGVECRAAGIADEAAMAHVNDVRYPDLAVVGLPVALLGYPLLLGLRRGGPGRGGSRCAA